MGQPDTTATDTSMVNQRDTTGNVEQQQEQQQQQDTMPQYQQADTAQGDSGKIELGKKVFEGTEGGANCYSCHGKDAKGTSLGPDLTDQQWIHGDGSPEFIKKIVQEGVANPKEFQGAMPPFQTTLNAEQLDAVVAYVRSLGGATGIGSN